MSARSVELSVGGMTCASCSRRVEKALDKISGVRASVNYATGVAFAEVELNVTDSELITAIEKTGYTAAISGKAIELYGVREFRTRLIFGAVLTIPLMAISMVTAFQFDRWQWVCLAISPGSIFKSDSSRRHDGYFGEPWSNSLLHLVVMGCCVHARWRHGRKNERETDSLTWT
jgi:cation transport ATPase